MHNNIVYNYVNNINKRSSSKYIIYVTKMGKHIAYVRNAEEEAKIHT